MASFRSDHNPDQMQKIQKWRDSHKTKKNTKEWIAIDILLSLSSIYEEQQLSIIEQKLSHVYKQILQLEKMENQSRSI